MNKFQEMGQSGIVPFTYIGKDEIHKYVQYEAFMTCLYG